MTAKTIALCVANEANDYQQALKADAVSAAARYGIGLKVYSADDNVMQQVRQLHQMLHGDPADRPSAVAVMTAGGSAIDRLARDFVGAGIGWISINRPIASLTDLRLEFPDVPIGFVSPDHYEIGRIQGRQFRALLPRGGHILYVQGSAISAPAVGRLEGMREAIKGTNLQLVAVLDGKWATRNAEIAVGGFLRMIMAGTSEVNLVGCQSDAMALGAANALGSVAEYLHRPDIAMIPVTGCDGTPTLGLDLVKQGKLVATIINPPTGGAAVEVLAAVWSRGERPPAELLLPPRSFPEEATLAGKFRG
jgi:ABC-type sugar transport system substrate-binding protein